MCPRNRRAHTNTQGSVPFQTGGTGVTSNHVGVGHFTTTYLFKTTRQLQDSCSVERPGTSDLWKGCQCCQMDCLAQMWFHHRKLVPTLPHSLSAAGFKAWAVYVDDDSGSNLCICNAKLILCCCVRSNESREHFFYLVSMLIRRRHDVAVSTGVDYGASYAFALQISICIANQLLSSCVHSSPTSGHLDVEKKPLRLRRAERTRRASEA